MNGQTNPVTRGVHHVGLTVPVLERTRGFSSRPWDTTRWGEVPDYPAVFLSDGSTMVTLWQASDPAKAVPFDRKNVISLHHLALKVSDDAVLNQIHALLQKTDGVDVEFAPEFLDGGATRHMMCNIPGGIRVEFIAPVG